MIKSIHTLTTKDLDYKDLEVMNSYVTGHLICMQGYSNIWLTDKNVQPQIDYANIEVDYIMNKLFES